MEVIDILTIIGYTITVFSLGYALGKDLSKKQQQPPRVCQCCSGYYVTKTLLQADRLSAAICFSIIIIAKR